MVALTGSRKHLSDRYWSCGQPGPHTHAGGADGRSNEMERTRVKRRKISVTMYQMSGCLYGYLLRGRPGAPRREWCPQVTCAPVTKGRGQVKLFFFGKRHNAGGRHFSPTINPRKKNTDEIKKKSFNNLYCKVRWRNPIPTLRQTFQEAA